MHIDEELSGKSNSTISEIKKCINNKELIHFDICDTENNYIQKNGLRALVDDLLPITKEISNRKFLRATKTNILDLNVLELVKKFEEKNVRYIVFKGYALSKSIYSDPNNRPYADIDLIIDPGQKRDVIKILNDLNYINPYDRDYSFTRGQIVRRKELTPHKIFLELDVHFYMIGNFILRDLYDFGELYNNRITFYVKDTKILTLSKTHRFIHCCIHYYLHNKKRDLIKDIWLYDIKLMIDNFEPKEVKKVIDAIEEHKLGLIIVEVLTEVNMNFIINNSVLEVFLNEMDCNSDIYKLKNTSVLSIYIKQLNKIHGLNNKFAFIYDTTIPDYKLLCLKYGKFNKLIYPIYLLIRCFNVTYDYGTRFTHNKSK